MHGAASAPAPCNPGTHGRRHRACSAAANNCGQPGPAPPATGVPSSNVSPRKTRRPKQEGHVPRTFARRPHLNDTLRFFLGSASIPPSPAVAAAGDLASRLAASTATRSAAAPPPPPATTTVAGGASAARGAAAAAAGGGGGAVPSLEAAGAPSDDAAGGTRPNANLACVCARIACVCVSVCEGVRARRHDNSGHEGARLCWRRNAHTFSAHARSDSTGSHLLVVLLIRLAVAGSPPALLLGECLQRLPSTDTVGQLEVQNGLVKGRRRVRAQVLCQHPIYHLAGLRASCHSARAHTPSRVRPDEEQMERQTGCRQHAHGPSCWRVSSCRLWTSRPPTRDDGPRSPRHPHHRRPSSVRRLWTRHRLPCPSAMSPRPRRAKYPPVA